MLVDMSGVHAVPAIEFGHGAQVDEPVHLDGLPEVAGRVSRDPVADRSNLLQFSTADRIGLGGCHLLRQGGMPLGQQDGGVAGNVHGLELLLLVGRFGIVDVVECFNPCADAFLQVQQAGAVHLPVHGRMTGSALLHELCEYARVVGFLPFLRDVPEDPFALRLALPVGDDLPLVRVDVFLTDVIGLERTGIQHVQVFHTVAGQFREGRDGLRPRAALADDQFVRPDVERLFRADLIKIPGAQDGYGILAVVFFIEGCLDERPFNGERGGRFHALLAQPPDPRVHAAVAIGVLDGEVHGLDLKHTNLALIFGLLFRFCREICKFVGRK